MHPCKLLRVAPPRYIIGLLLLVISLTLSSSFVFSAPGDETTYYFLNDHLGSAETVLDAQGNVVERRDYLPYGEEHHVHEELDAPDTAQGFTGKELDDETGLQYYSARYYDAVIGKFISMDPVVLDAGKASGQSLLNTLTNPQLLNSYSYAANNPLKYTDSTGEFPFAVFIDPTKIEGFAYGQEYSPEPLTDFERSAIAFVGTLPIGGGLAEIPEYLNQIRTALQIGAKVSGAKTPKWLEPAELTPTEKYGASRLRKVQSSMERANKYFTDQPVKYYENDGTKYIVDGHHRAQAAQNLNLKVWAKEVDETFFQGRWGTKAKDFIEKAKNYEKSIEKIDR